MSLWQAIWQCVWQKWASAGGRASRSVFVAFLVFYMVFCVLWIGGIYLLTQWVGDISLVDFTLGYAPYFLLPPLVSVAIRRLHDLSRSGWLILLYLVPFINLLALALLFMPGRPGPNRYGPEPPKIVWGDVR